MSTSDTKASTKIRAYKINNHMGDLLTWLFKKFIEKLLAMLLLLLNHSSQANRVDRKNIMPSIVKEIMRYVNKNLTEELSLSKLSEITHYNSTYISSVFKKHTGLTLREYILDLKIEKAKTLLLNGASVSDSCHQSGFSDYSNFIRAFTKATGVSPGKYARSIKK